MNRHTAKLFLPLVQALADGKTIRGRASAKHDWVDFEDGEEVDFTDPPDHYQIKPEPFECYMNIYDTGSHIAWDTREEAEDCSGLFKTVHMVEKL